MTIIQALMLALSPSMALLAILLCRPEIRHPMAPEDDADNVPDTRGMEPFA
jgi:hypothetical protein